MTSREKLSAMLKTITKNVYFQPPPTFQMKYPCIKYELASGDTQFASNNPYRFTRRYKVTYIDSNPDSDVPGKIAMLPMCVFDRHYTADNLNHDVFNIYV